MNKTKIFVAAASCMAFLASCGGGTSYGSSVYQKWTYQPAATSSYRQWTTSFYSSAKSSKQKLKDYIMSVGTYSASDGDYTISNVASISGVSVIDMIYYSPSKDQFTTLSSMTTTSTYGTVYTLSMAIFSWGAFTSGSFIGGTTYKLTTGTTYENQFSFFPTFNTCPNFTVNSYLKMKTEYSGSVATDAKYCADCLTRAINRLINLLPMAGIYENLW